MKKLHTPFITLLFLLTPFLLRSQNVGINQTGAAPDPSAMLDVVASDMGVLIPRVELNDASTQAPIAAAPQEGLLIYNETGTEPNGFYYWDGGQWIPFTTGGSAFNTSLVLNGNTLELTDGGGTLTEDLSSLVDDADSDPTNEYNTNVNLNGTTLEITDNGGTLTQDLSSLGGASYWDRDATNGYIFPSTLTDHVGIGTNTPTGKLHVATSGEPDMLYIDQANDVLGIAKQPSTPSLISGPPGVEIYKPMEIGSDGGGGEQATIGYWFGPDVAIMPESDGFGYVGYDDGTSTYAWWGMYSYNYNAPSMREKKRDITPVKGGLERKVMEDIETIDPSFYYYNADPKSFSENPYKYRAQMRLGLIADDAPDYLLSQSFAGVDLYAVSSLALAGVKHNKKAIEELQEEKGGTVTVEDFGSVATDGKTIVRVEFGEAFRNELQGKDPIIHLTPSEPVQVGATEKSSEGFSVVLKDPVEGLSVDWVARAKVERERTVGEEKKGAIDPELQKRLDVPESEKEKIIQFLQKEGPQESSSSR